MKLIVTVAIILIPPLILSTIYTQSMQMDYPPNTRKLVRCTPRPKKITPTLSPEEQQKYEDQALHAKQYNQKNGLLMLPNHALNQIFSLCQTHDNNQAKPLKESIKLLMTLSSSCKNFNAFLTFDIIGHLCKNYTTDYKNETLTYLIKKTDTLNYQTQRLPILILICAGANIRTDAHSDFLLQKAVAKNDTQMITTLFKYETSPQLTLAHLGPIFFRIKTAEIVHLFINQGVNAYIPEKRLKAKIFQQIMEDAYSSKIMELYLAHNSDAPKLCFQNNSSLLHVFAKPFTMAIHNTDNFLKKGSLILNAMPDMINVLNKAEQTPLDVAQESLKASKRYGTPKAFEKLIALFREYGGKTMDELYPNCIICMDKYENILEVPCINKHDECYLCFACYGTLLTTSDNCPLCRSLLRT